MKLLSGKQCMRWDGSGIEVGRLSILLHSLPPLFPVSEVALTFFLGVLSSLVFGLVNLLSCLKGSIWEENHFFCHSCLFREDQVLRMQNLKRLSRLCSRSPCKSTRAWLVRRAEGLWVGHGLLPPGRTGQGASLLWYLPQ